MIPDKKISAKFFCTNRSVKSKVIDPPLTERCGWRSHFHQIHDFHFQSRLFIQQNSVLTIAIRILSWNFLNQNTCIKLTGLITGEVYRCEEQKNWRARHGRDYSPSLHTSLRSRYLTTFLPLFLSSIQPGSGEVGETRPPSWMIEPIGESNSSSSSSLV